MFGSLRHCCQLTKKRKLCWFGHVSRSNIFAKNIQQGKSECARPRGRPKMEWMDNIIKWTSKEIGDLLLMTKDRNKWRCYCMKYSNSYLKYQVFKGSILF